MSRKALSVDRAVRVRINLQPLAAGRRSFGNLLIVGASPVIDQTERLRVYTSLDGIAAEFGIDAPEYQAAALFFAQTPRPATVHIGRWLKDGAPARVKGAVLQDAARLPESWHDVKKGTLEVTVNGTDCTLDSLNFSKIVTLEGLAHAVSEALAPHGARADYDGSRFILSTLSSGGGQTLLPARGELATRMGLCAQTALPPAPGADPETAPECVVALADHSADWYGLAFADSGLTIADHLAVSAFIEAAAPSRIYAVTTTDSRVLDASFEQDIASHLKALTRRRTLVVYSQNPYAAISALGRAFTVNFNANRSTITLKFKRLPGIVAEHLTETQARALEAKRCNFFAAYDNETAIFGEGVMAGDAYFDEIHGLDWLENAVQNAVWNLLYQSKTKIPQTDSGVNQIVTAIEAVLSREATHNGLIAPGVWNADGFGLLERGQRLEKGYYIYTQRVDEQPQSERERRKAPPIQVAVKLAGAIHSVDVQIDVNR